MTRFVQYTINDMRRGHQTVRVFVALCTPALAAAVLFLAAFQRVA